MRLRGLALALLLGVGHAGDELALVRIGDPWRYLRGNKEASDPPDRWRQTGFNDGNWARSPSGFALDYYGYEASVIYDPTRSFQSLYLRREFVVEQPETVTWLILRIDWTGGFVAYLNGLEVARRGLPGAPGDLVSHDTAASVRSSGVPEHIDLTAFRHLLAGGLNTLAIQWHTSSPIPYGATCVPELLANFIRGPMVQNTTATSQHILWRTLVPATSAVEFGLTPALGATHEDLALVTNHVAFLPGLSPGTAYFYRIRSTTGDQTALSPVASFRTLNAEGPVTFVVAGDIGMGSIGQFGVAQSMKQAQPDLVILTGDIVYPSFTAGRADFHFLSVHQPQMQSTPFFPAAGNHDVAMGGAQEYYDTFLTPTNPVTRRGDYYSFDAGCAHFVCLYAPYMSPAYAPTNGDPQMLWLEADLAASLKPWKFIYLHPPLASSGPHGDDDYNYNGIPDPDDLSALILPAAQRYGVQAIFSGHDHDYELFTPANGVHEVVTGGGGGSLYQLTSLHPRSSQFWSRYHWLKVSVTEAELNLQAVDAQGAVFDAMSIRRMPPAPQTYPATWHTALADSAAADDGDGNLVGQRFDFLGASIPTMPGDFSNLGRLRVNYDHSTLFLGFEQLLIPGDANVFLFVDSPHRPGVATLAGLGNGLVDPDGQGVDGLDFLENLSFTNFAPCVAAVLGDEYGDGQFRHFARTNYATPLVWPYLPVLRTNLALDIGQGVFRLDPGFTDVPGARLQQFNRSPQTNTVFGEQNANFVVLALPLAELGLAPGDRFRLAAVVGGSQFLTDQDRQARWLDRSYLGASFRSAGAGPGLLEGVEVELGPDLDPDGDGLTSAEELALGTDPAKADTDGDGLPDGWEVANNFNPLSALGNDGGGGDPDADGFSNAAEYAAGTRPRDRNSVLRLVCTRRGDGRLEFQWPAVAGRAYRLASAPGFRGPWSPVAGSESPARTSSGPASLLLPAGDPAAASTFFRLEVVP